MTVEHVLGASRARRPPKLGPAGSLTYIEHDLEAGRDELALLEYRMRALPFAEARARRPDGHRAWVGLERDRWVKVDVKLTGARTRRRALHVAAGLIGRRRGPVVAFTGPDGAGKTTLIETLSGSLPAQVRVHYLGRGGGTTPRKGGATATIPDDGPDRTVTAIDGSPRASHAAPSLVAECLFVLRWAARDWGRTARAHLDARLGAVVLCDRHPVEARSRRRREHGLAHWLEQRLTPGARTADVFVLLAGEPAELHRRKPEHDPETLADMIRLLRSALPATAVEIDATDSPASVAAQAAEVVHGAWLRTTGRNVRGLPALSEGPDRPCLLVDASGSAHVEKVLARTDRREVERLVVRASASGAGRVHVDELRPRSHRPVGNRLVAAPTAWSLRTGAPTPLEAAVEASGMRDVGPPRIGAGGGLTVTGRSGDRSALLRLGGIGSAADPAHHAAGLEWAGTVAVAAPELIASGEVAGHRWSLEEMIIGDQASLDRSRVTDRAAHAWIRDMIAARRAPGASTLPQCQCEELVEHFPRFRSGLETLRERFEGPLAALGSAPAHGDMWSGNLVAAASGAPVAVDWDAWSESAVVALDLVHFHIEQRRRFGDAAGSSLGALLQRRPWDDVELATAVRTVVDDAGPRAIEAITFAVWLNAAANTLRRTPSLRWSERWASHNIAGALVAFGS